MKGTSLAVSREGEFTILTLDRPAVGNALSAALVEELDAALAAAEADGSRLVVIQGAGKSLCTGFDLSGLDAESEDSLLARFVRLELLLQRLHTAPFATLALAKGRVVGAGADLFAACEYRWIVDHASFAFPGAGFGLVLGTGRLAKLVGASRAREWICSGRVISAEEATSGGLANDRKWGAEIGEAQERLLQQQLRLEPETHRRVRAASLERDSFGAAAADMLALVQSAARPGLKERIFRYRAQAIRERQASQENTDAKSSRKPSLHLREG
ncbi:enoyl-CoA hydratase/isomerase family protein [Variovorax sp. WS11]|uniref:enoyl-CoA hydratase/isomerase family protein n=1 Tax=Variovorax sp. WS11 TaxID=1105204 RepID=UPI000D0C97D0|nr:enoyl-CoA hydratase/isomerase family protein [Variovorax sp. WS11]NDZ18054.1 enoyl-CoA hydratase/isomerase family protein [Variovorax sp. WS11]PSL80014.1 enoyl-CoA hydratase/isomerase family protein [Variovorax sp. WS11]